jgi:hypothetical protein
MEHAWVVVRGARRRRRNGRHVDAITGRTSREHLLRTGIGTDVWPGVEAAFNRGADPEVVASEIGRVTAEHGRLVAAELQRTSPQMLREHRAQERGFKRRMRIVWGPALDRMYAIYVAAEELGSNLQQLHQDEDDDVTEALLGLYARSCLVFAEVHAALSTGFPLAAWARARTLHENAVVAAVIGSYGREKATLDLAARFLSHAAIYEARDLEVAANAGIGIDHAVLDSARTRRAELVDRYGETFAFDYGWARPLMPDLPARRGVPFARLEALSDTGLDRWDYTLANHHVHASAHSVNLNLMNRGGAEFRLTGPTNYGLGEPALLAMRALLASIESIVHDIAAGPPEPMNLLGLAALAELIGDAMDAFDRGRIDLEQREARLDSRQAGRTDGP